MKNNNNDIIENGNIPEAQLHLLLIQAGIEVPQQAFLKMTQHLALIQQWNNYASLVSTGDLAYLVDRHLVDSLSLAPYVLHTPHAHLDIGSGGGFPAIPLKCLFPERELLLLERSGKKVGFLRKVVGALGLTGIQIVQGDFPRDVPNGIAFGSVTARAVERPENLARDLARWIPPDTVFLCQTGEGERQFGPGFHVEHVQDAWDIAGLRRGSLALISKRG